jgi:anti-sigma regulatory factor (Ser/Thr protein kinase)
MSKPAPTAAQSGVREAHASGGRLVLVLDERLEAIEGARLAVVAHLAPLALGAKAANRLEVVLEELISNVLRHGFEGDGGHSMLLAVAAGPGDVEITLEDDGRPFDPTGVPDPAPLTSVETARVGGLGLKAVRRFAAWRYEAAPDSADWRAFVDADAAPANRLVVRLPTAD